MLSKELFVYACGLIERKDTDSEALCEALERCSPQEQINAFIYSEYEELVVNLVCEALDVDSDLLSWWFFEKEMGKAFKPGDYCVGSEEIDLSTPEKFYDYVRKDK